MTENGEENNNAVDHGVGGRHGGVSVVVGGVFEHGWYHTTVRSH